MLYLLQKLLRLGGLAAQSAANTAAATTAWIDVRQHEGDIMFTTNVGAGTGTMTPSVEDATDGSGTGAAAITPTQGAFAAGFNSAQQRTIPAKATRGFVRVVGTIATGPCLIGIDVYGIPKN
jgi:hypothetical protein